MLGLPLHHVVLVLINADAMVLMHLSCSVRFTLFGSTIVDALYRLS